MFQSMAKYAQKAAPEEIQVPQEDGIALGDMTDGEGGASLSNAFDGVTSGAAWGATAKTGNVRDCWIGKDWEAGTTHAITRMKFYGANNIGLHEGDTPIEVEVREGDTLPANLAAAETEGTLIGTTGSIVGGVLNEILDVVCTGSQKRYVWCYCRGTSSNNKWGCVELEFYATD